MRQATVATEKRLTVQLDIDTHTVVKRYSELTGVPMTRVLDTALVDWMATVGAARLEALKRSGKTGSKDLAKVLNFKAAN